MSIPQKLRRLADSMQTQIDRRSEMSTIRQRMTPKRAREAEGNAKEAQRLRRVQIVLRRLADMHDSGKMPECAAKIHLRPVVESLLARENMGKPFLRRDEIQKLYDWGRANGYEKNAHALAFTEHEVDDDPYVKIRPEEFPEIWPLFNAAVKAGALGTYYSDSLSDYKQFVDCGLESQEQYTEARKVLLGFAEGIASTRNEQLAAAELKLVGRRIPGYFPTPKTVVEQMLEQADIEPGMSVLEPSAGKGNIADLIRECHPEAELSVIEINPTLSEILTLKGHNVVDLDSLEHRGRYDRIIMNPPFEDAQDAEHVRHAFELLNPGGRLVAIMSEGTFFRQHKKEAAFREWLESVDGTSEKLPAGAFFASENPTGVATRLVVINKPLCEVAAA